MKAPSAHLFALAAILVLASSCRPDLPEPGDYPGEHRALALQVDGLGREFTLYLPSTYNGTLPAPLLFVIHGGGGSDEGMMKLADFRPIAERDTVLLVYPQGIDKSWNDGRPSKANQRGIDDVAFYREMCRFLIATFAIDTTRIYATGLSNGGFMSSRLGCDLSDRIAAIAPVAATLEADSMAPACNPPHPMPALYIHGTDDRQVPFAGGEMTIGAGGFILSHLDILAHWARLNGCDSLPLITERPDIAQEDGTIIRDVVYTCPSAEVAGITITGGGHTWPQGWQYLGERLVGRTSQEFNGCEEVWGFLRRWRR